MKTRHKKMALDRPFNRAILREARRLAALYRLRLEQDRVEGWIGCAIEYPEAIGVGRTPAACVKATLVSITAGLATMLEAGERPPKPLPHGVSARRRTG